MDGSGDNGCLSGQQTVAVCVSECAWLSSVDWSRVYIWLSLWPFHHPLAINLSMQAAHRGITVPLYVKWRFLWLLGCARLCADKKCVQCLCEASVIRKGCGWSGNKRDRDSVMSYADVNMAQWKRYLLHIFILMKQKSSLTATPTCQCILHQHVHNAIPLFMLIAACTIITAIGNKTGKTNPTAGANYCRQRIYDFHCPVKCERQHSLAIIIVLVFNQLVIKYQH